MAGDFQYALVTGGNRGIGFEVAKSLLAAPTEKTGGSPVFVFVGCRSLSAGEGAVAALAAALGPEAAKRARPVVIDVTAPSAAIKAVGDETREMCGEARLDILVNNAGILLEAGDEASDRAWADDKRAVTAETLRVNFDALVDVTASCLPLLERSQRAKIISTSSGCGTRMLGQLLPEDHACLASPTLDLETLRERVQGIAAAICHDDPPAGEEGARCRQYQAIATPAYGLSKLAVNCYTQIVARDHPAIQCNAASPGFTNTGMCANYTGKRVPKEPALGASVFLPALFGAAGLPPQRTATFFKETSQPGTRLEDATCKAEGWVS